MLSFDTYSWLLFFTAFLSLVIAVDVQNKKFTNGKIPFVSLMMMIAFWALAGALENAFLTQGTKILFTKIEYIGSRCTPLLFLMFVMGFTKSKRLDKYLLSLWILPILVIILAFTNEYHGLVWRSIKMSDFVNNKLVYVYGFAHMVASLYTTLLLIISVILLVESIQISPEYFSKQLKFILAVSSIPLIVTFIFTSNILPFQWHDIRPMGYMISGLILLLGIYRYNLFSLTPIARDVLVERMQGCVLVLDKHRHVIDANPAALRLLKIEDDWLWKKLDQLFPSLDNLLSTPVDDKVKAFDIYLGEPINVWFDVSISELKSKHNHVFGYLLILRDITAKKMYEKVLENFNAKLTASERELRELNLQKNKLLSIIGHDLRNPFHQILGLSQLIAQADDSLDKAELKSMGEMLYQSARKGDYILKNLLEWSQLQAKGIQFNPIEADLNKIVADAISMVDLIAKEKKISLEFECKKEYKARIDKHMMLTVIRNLLTNAVKFSHENSIIKVSIDRDADHYIITVADQGVGIKPEDIPKLFRYDEKFSLAGTSGEQGTGLGLSLCKDFVDKHKGEIRVESILNQGSKFIISLPMF